MNKYTIRFYEMLYKIKIKINDIWDIAIKSFKTVLHVICDWFAVILMLVNPYVTAILFVIMFIKRGNNFDIGIEWIFPVFIHLAVFFMVEFKEESRKKKEKRNEMKFPVAKKRFTDRDDFGNVIMKEDDVHEALEYLCAVEDFLLLKDRGVINVHTPPI